MNINEIFDVIVQNTREVVPTLEFHGFDFEDSLKSLGANSVDRSEIIMMSLESLELNVAMINFSRAENMGDLAAIMHEMQ